MTGEINMGEVVQHTEGLAEDNSWSFGTAATRMAMHLDGTDAEGIISAKYATENEEDY